MKNNAYFVGQISRFFRERQLFHNMALEKSKHIMSDTFIFENRAVFKIMQKNIVHPNRLQWPGSSVGIVTAYGLD